MCRSLLDFWLFLLNFFITGCFVSEGWGDLHPDPCTWWDEGNQEHSLWEGSCCCFDLLCKSLLEIYTLRYAKFLIILWFFLQVCKVGGDCLFLGSRLANSLLLKYTRLAWDRDGKLFSKLNDNINGIWLIWLLIRCDIFTFTFSSSRERRHWRSSCSKKNQVWRTARYKLYHSLYAWCHHYIIPYCCICTSVQSRSRRAWGLWQRESVQWPVHTRLIQVWSLW